MSKNKDTIKCKRCSKPKGEGEGFCNCGRPTDYNAEYPEQIVAWFLDRKEVMYAERTYYKADGETQFISPDGIDHGGMKKETPKIVRDMFPTLERRCTKIGIHKDTLYQWKKDHPKFSDSVDICKQIQESILIECALNGTYNSSFAQFILKNNHGYKDKQEHEHTGADGGPIQTSVLILPPRNDDGEDNTTTA